MITPRHPAALLALLLGLTGAPARGQRAQPIAALRSDERPMPASLVGEARSDATDDRPSLHVGRAVGAGLVLGSVGFLAGAAVGIQSAEGCHGEDCSLPAAVIGALAGEAIGVGIGTHLGAGGRGSAFEATAASVAVMSVAALGTIATRGYGAPVLLVVPVGQIAAVLALEHD